MEEGEGKSDPTSRASPDKRAEEVEGVGGRKSDPGADPRRGEAAPHEGATSAAAAKALFSGLDVSDEEQEEEEVSSSLPSLLRSTWKRRPCLGSKSVCTRGADVEAFRARGARGYDHGADGSRAVCCSVRPLHFGLRAAGSV